MLDIKTIPVVELQRDLEESLLDIHYCEVALLVGVTSYSGGAVSERIKANNHFVEVITEELRRRRMTTAAAARLYEAQHLYAMEGKETVVYNPLQKDVDSLPHILCFNNGGSDMWYEALAVSEDGVCLGAHVCSSEAYMPYDLGVLDRARPDRHKTSYSKHYPDGYVMEWVPSDQINTNERLQKSIQAAKERNSEGETLKDR